MDTFNERLSTKPALLSWLYIALSVSLHGLLFWVMYPFKGEQRFVLVYLFKKNDAINFSKNYESAALPINAKNYRALLAEKGGGSVLIHLLLLSHIFYSV